MPDYTVRLRLRVTGGQEEVELRAKQLAADLVERPGVKEVWATRPREIKPPPGRPAHDRQAAEQWLRWWLRRRRKPVPTAQVYSAAELAGFSRRTLRRAADSIGVIRLPKGGGSNTTWSMPPATPKPEPEETQDAA
jgi:hypothetical protein